MGYCTFFTLGRPSLDLGMNPINSMSPQDQTLAQKCHKYKGSFQENLVVDLHWGQSNIPDLWQPSGVPTLSSRIARRLDIYKVHLRPFILSNMIQIGTSWILWILCKISGSKKAYLDLLFAPNQGPGDVHWRQDFEILLHQSFKAPRLRGYGREFC